MPKCDFSEAPYTMYHVQYAMKPMLKEDAEPFQAYDENFRGNISTNN